MSAAMVNRDPMVDALEHAEIRLQEWGRACRANSERLGLPRISGIQRLIDHVRREDRLRRGVRKKKTGKDKAENEPEKTVTAQGSQTRSFRAPSVIMNSKVADVDAIVAKLPGWMQSVIIRSYLYGQPDRTACQDLRIAKSLYRQRREAALEYVAERLAFRS